jgi:hypothetical protein
MFIEIPAKILTGQATSITPYTLWPYNIGGNDIYWSGGSNPKYYQWQMTMNINVQNHSSFRTRQPYAYNAMDINVGDYIADTSSGIAVKIISIAAKTDSTVTCIVEDVLRYNTFRDVNTLGNGIFSSSSVLMIFELNEEGMPVIDPAPGDVGANVVSNLLARFTNFEENYNFILSQTDHGFVVGDIIAADHADNGFALANSSYPFLVGTVTNTDLGPDDFMINPFQKITDGYSSLLGTVGSIVYADPSNNGEMTLTGDQPILIKLRQETNTVVTGSNLASGANTAVSNVLNINFVPVTIGNTGSVSDFVSAVNAVTSNTGVVANLVQLNPIATTNQAWLSAGPGVIFVQVPSEVNINGSNVTITTTTSGFNTFGSQPGFADQFDVATDINAASISGIVASADSTSVSITDTNGAPIILVNIGVDGAGNPFAGVGSSTGLPLSTTSGSDYITLICDGAGPINLYDVSGSTVDDFGLYSAENGIKAAAMVIEQGVRQASTFVVTSIAARDALTVATGDQAYVQNVGNGEWAFYIFNSDSSWVKISDQDSSETDAQTYELTITPTSNAVGTIHTISNGRRVTFVTVTVNEAFDSDASITVGDSIENDRLMTADQNDLTTVSDFSTTPSFTYATGSDTAINYYFEANGATQGNAVVAITYT